MREYTVQGPAGDMTVLLSDEEAKARGLTPAAEVPSKARKPANKQADPENKSAAQSKRDEAVSRAMNKPTKRSDAD